MLEEPERCDIGIIDQGADRVDDFSQIMWRDVRCHPDGYSCSSVDEQVWESGRKHDRFLSRFVVIRNKIDSILVHVLHEDGPQMGELGFCVPHGSGRIAIHGAEVSLTLNELLPHRP